MIHIDHKGRSLEIKGLTTKYLKRIRDYLVMHNLNPEKVDYIRQELKRRKAKRHSRC